MSSLAFIGLGSNLGDRRAALEGAIAALAQTPGVHVRDVSSFHETEPVGGPSRQGKYLNAALVLETTLDPFAVLRLLQEIEARLGRVRTVRWGERTLDLDLLLFDDRIIDAPDLVVPHPRYATRRFVLEPLAEIAPEAVDPVTKQTVADLLANLLGRGMKDEG
jgi:2-amino-4-hydroxy-6-hydroxymethyldihydropteridine diphosphokinase